MTGAQAICPCGSGRTYALCCQPLHLGENTASSAEALMRSRYVAYVQLNESYLLSTWHTSTCPTALNLKDGAAAKWLGLKIIQTQHGQPEDKEGRVEFVARYKINGKAYKLHEVSRFVKEAGRWYYVSGEVEP